MNVLQLGKLHIYEATTCSHPVIFITSNHGGVYKARHSCRS